jgi:hypothetical protein
MNMKVIMEGNIIAQILCQGENLLRVNSIYIGKVKVYKLSKITFKEYSIFVKLDGCFTLKANGSCSHTQLWQWNSVPYIPPYRNIN